MSFIHCTSITASLILTVMVAGCTVVLPSGDIVEVPIDKWSTVASDEVEKQDVVKPVALDPVPEPVLFSLLLLSEGKPLPARDIFAQVSPAVAHISTLHSTGSAVLVEHGYLISAAHVVWPYESVRAVFPDGTEFEDLPVAAWDLMADVALLGPLDMDETDITPLNFADGSDLPVGSEVYLIGYPAEFEEYPQPALGRGLLSRLREWKTTGISMFQVDADVSGGQSGGAMVTEHGDLVGITNYRFLDSNNPMVTSSADVVPVLTDMLMRRPHTLADRRPLAKGSSLVHEGVLEDELGYDYYLLFADAGDEIELSVAGVGRPIVAMGSIQGVVLQSSTPRTEQVNGIATTVYEPGPYLVEVTQPSNNRNAYTLTSSNPLFAVNDSDDGRQLQLGDTYIGGIDNPGDSDHFTIDLRAGDKLVVQAEALAIDPVIVLRYTSPAREELVTDDDSGPTGLFGLNARAVFEAPEDGEYTILVADAINNAIGGYILTVAEGMALDPVTVTALSREFYLASIGTCALYESASLPFTILYPARSEASDVCGEEATACFGGETWYLGIYEASLPELAPSERDPDKVFDMMIELLEGAFSDIETLGRRTITTYQGLNGLVESMTALDESVYFAFFLFFDEDIGMFMASFGTELSADTNVGFVEEAVESVFSSFHVYDEQRLADDVAFYLEQAMHSAAKGEYHTALNDLDFALMLNDGLVEAYALRAQIHENMGSHDLALADLETASELEPDKAELILRQAYRYWHKGDYAQALASTRQAIEIHPNDQEIYNSRALFQAFAGNYEGALDELDKYETMVEDGLSLDALDTRAFTHLKFGALEEALADYEEVLADDFQNAYTLLGAGITLARLDRMDEALPLLTYGMDKFEDAEYEDVNPQLAELMAWANEILESETKQ